MSGANDGSVTEEQLLQRHKKERKDLQAQIQVLKKSVCKGDKKKKKEITEEITRLESDLDKKHEEELAGLKISELTIVEDSDTCKEIVIKPEEESPDGSDDLPDPHPQHQQHHQNQRVSKAQRRREKKAEAEKERNQRIEEEEAQNEFHKRNVEIQAINVILEQRGLTVHEVPSDGHCLYNAVAHQLAVLGEIPLGLQDLRSKTATYLKENMNDFLPFLLNPDTDEILSPEQFEKYCNDVADTSAWGGAVELQVLSHILKCPIEVIQATGAPYVVGDQYRSNDKKVTLTYHRHMYELGAHYNSVKKVTDDLCEGKLCET